MGAAGVLKVDAENFKKVLCGPCRAVYNFCSGIFKKRSAGTAGIYRNVYI